MNRPLASLRFSLVGALTFLAACSSQTGATRGADLEGPRVVSSADPTQAAAEPQINSRAKLLFEDAVKAFEAQKKARTYDYPSLERKFAAALDADGRLAEAEYNLGVLAERQGKKEEAVKRYESALRRKPTLKEAAENLAVLEQNRGNVQAAANTYREILERYPDDASSRARLAELYRQSNDHDQALALAREALMREPRTLPAYKVMMLTYLERRQFAMAKLVALRALKLDDSDPELYHTVGLVLLEEGDPVRARAQFKKAVEVRPDYQPSHVYLAKMALQTEDYAGAEQHLRAILQTGGKSAEVFLNLGVAYKGMGQADKAMQAYDDAEKLNPELPALALNRGIILHKVKGAPERGLQLYEKYLALAGGEAALPGDAAVFKLIEEARATLAAKEEEKRVLEEAARMEKEMKEQERQNEASGEPASTGEVKPAAAAPAKRSEPSLATPAAPAVKPAPAKAPPADAAEPKEEPSDAL